MKETRPKMQRSRWRIRNKERQWFRESFNLSKIPYGVFYFFFLCFFPLLFKKREKMGRGVEFGPCQTGNSSE